MTCRFPPMLGGCTKRSVAAGLCREHVEAELAYAQQQVGEYAALLNDARADAWHWKQVVHERSTDAAR